jgi:hypothetical protein
MPELPSPFHWTERLALSLVSVVSVGGAMMGASWALDTYFSPEADSVWPWLVLVLVGILAGYAYKWGWWWYEQDRGWTEGGKEWRSKHIRDHHRKHGIAFCEAPTPQECPWLAEADFVKFTDSFYYVKLYGWGDVASEPPPEIRNLTATPMSDTPVLLFDAYFGRYWETVVVVRAGASLPDFGLLPNDYKIDLYGSFVPDPFSDFEKLELVPDQPGTGNLARIYKRFSYLYALVGMKPDRDRILPLFRHPVVKFLSASPFWHITCRNGDLIVHDPYAHPSPKGRLRLRRQAMQLYELLRG